MQAMAKYINFEVLEFGTNFDKISDPWYDSFLVSKKPGSGSVENLENKMDNLEKKLDLIMQKINND